MVFLLERGVSVVAVMISTLLDMAALTLAALVHWL
jgi:hypothetical protein